jgi:hypothetical protein
VSNLPLKDQIIMKDIDQGRVDVLVLLIQLLRLSELIQKLVVYDLGVVAEPLVVLDFESQVHVSELVQLNHLLFRGLKVRFLLQAELVADETLLILGEPIV